MGGDGELLPKDHTLKFVYITRWRTKAAPLKLIYAPKVDMEKEIEKATKTSGKKSSHSKAPQWKLQPKLNYDDDDDES